MRTALSIDIHQAPVSAKFSLRGVRCEVQRGELMGLIGPNGSGKSTLFRVLCGLTPRPTGSILWEETLLIDVPPHNRPFSVKFQAPGLFPSMTVLDNLALPFRIRGERFDSGAARELLRELEAHDLEDRFPSALSGGERQRAALARTLLDPRPVLLLDEPFAALDAKSKVLARELVRRHVRDRRRACIIIEHELDELFGIVDHCVVLRRGQQVGVRLPMDIARRPRSLFEARFSGYRNILEMASSKLAQLLQGRADPNYEEHLHGVSYLVIPEDAVGLQPKRDTIALAGIFLGMVDHRGRGQAVFKIGEEAVFGIAPIDLGNEPRDCVVHFNNALVFTVED